MEHIEKRLYEFLTDHSSNMTDELLDNIDTSGVGVYAEAKNSEASKTLREMNGQFINSLTNILIDKEVSLAEWSETIALNRLDTATPLYDVISNFAIFRSIFYSYIEKFIEQNEKEIKSTKVIHWIRKVSESFDEAIKMVTEKYINDYNRLFTSQKDTIDALGTPLIIVEKGLGIIPLVGEIDTYRVAQLIETSLHKASEKGIEYIVLDLSGVPMIDTMVANKIFQLGKSFDLLGIKMIITGMRPEIAQTSISLGLDFSKMKTFAHLYQAISHIRNMR